MKENISKTLKEIRISKKIKQNFLAEKAGITNAYLSEIENGKKTPTIEVIKAICDALDVDPYVFFITASLKDKKTMNRLENNSEFQKLKEIILSKQVG